MTEMPLPSRERVRYVSMLRAAAPLVIASTLVMVALAVFLSSRQESLFRATAEVFVAGGELQTAFAEVPLLSSDPERILATQARAARVPEVAEIAIADSNAADGMTAKGLLNNSEVLADPEADVLEFSVTDSDKATSAQLADDYAAAYIKFRQRADTEALRRAQQDVQAQIEAAREQGNLDDLAVLTDKLDGLRTRELLGGNSASLGQPASDPEQTQPKTIRNGVLAAMLGLLLGSGIVVARRSLNTRAETPQEVEARLGAPLLARIPAPAGNPGPSSLAAIEEPQSLQAEAYRTLATNFELLNIDRGATSILITSAVHSEGKSTTAANLAAVFARGGLHVVLLEADLRRPVLAKLFDLGDRPGLTEVALGRVSLDQALTKIQLSPSEEESARGPVDEGVLEVLSCGALPASPGEFLKADAVDEIIFQLDIRADLLLIDTPPVVPVSDALTLMTARGVDCTMLAVRLGETRRQDLDEMRRGLDSAPVLKLGFFATGSHAQEGYGRGYSSGYGRSE